MVSAAAVLVLGVIEPSWIGGSMGTVFECFGPSLFSLLLAIARVRWCWVGRIRGPKPDRFGGRGDAMAGLDSAGDSVRFPECGADARERRAIRPVPLARVRLDLPGVPAFLEGAVIAVGWAMMLADGLFEVSATGTSRSAACRRRRPVARAMSAEGRTLTQIQMIAVVSNGI